MKILQIINKLIQHEMMMSPKIVFMVTLYLIQHVVYGDNILRLADQRYGKFVLRREGMVPDKTPHFQFNTTQMAVCVDKCVAKPPCKSVNFNKDLGQCQLVDYDIADGKNYVSKTGWENYDTGRSSLTRIQTSNGQYCMVPDYANICTDGADITGYIYAVFKPISDPFCQGIRAYYDFDQDAGVIVHYCSSLVLYRSGSYAQFIQMKDYPYKPYEYSSLFRWRFNRCKFIFENKHYTL